MNDQPLAPRHIGRWRSVPILWRIGVNVIPTVRRLHSAYGPFVILTYPHSRAARPELLGVVADSGLYRTMFTDLDRWRNVKIVFGGIKHHASQRLSGGFTRLRGARHAYYRRLVAKPMSRPAVATMSDEMAVYAEQLVESWPRDQATDLVPLARNVMQGLAIGLLFGNDRQRAQPLTDMVARQFDSYRLIPGRETLSWLWTASRQERLILEWAEQKRGNIDAKDLMSIIVNNPDERGEPVSGELVTGLLSFTFGAAFETCRNGLAWTLIMLAQHPEIACRLGEEIRAALRGNLPTMDRIDALQLLDGVVKEGMRLFPPIAMLARKSIVPVSLGTAEFPANTRVIVSAYLINRNPEIYPDPQRFLPERWNGFEPPPHQYAVFGAGGRMCPGFFFAMQMIKISLATILSRFHVEILPNTRIDYVNRVTFSPYPRIPVVLRRSERKPSAGPVNGRIHELVQLPRLA